MVLATSKTVLAPVVINNDVKVHSVGLYVRLSVEDSGKTDGYSLENQISFLKDYISGKEEFNLYKIYIDNGTTDISVNIGSHVLRNSFGPNDPFGFYQATLSLTESDI